MIGPDQHFHRQIKMRLARIERAIEDQKVFVHRVPDPDTRERADGHLLELIEMRESMRASLLSETIVY